MDFKRLWAMHLAIILAAPPAGAAHESKRISSPSELRVLYEQAESAFQAAQWGSAEELFRDVLGRSYWLRGRLHRRLGRFDEAVEDLRVAQKLNPDDVAVRTELGVALFGNQQFEPTVRLLEQLVEQGHASAEVLATLGRAYFSLGTLPLARRNLEKALALNPTDHLTGYTLGFLLLRQRNRIGADRILSQLRAAVGDSARFRLLIGRAYLEADFYEEAESNLKRALAMDPAIHYAHHLLGLSALRQDETGKVEEAQREFEAEIANNPEGFAPLFMLGVVVEMKREWSKAQTYLRRAGLTPAVPDGQRKEGRCVRCGGLGCYRKGGKNRERRGERNDEDGEQTLTLDH